MAGAGYKLFATGDVLSASDVNTYMMQQTVMVFANSTARTTALSSVLAEGMVSYLQDTNSLEVYDGSAWVGATGDITGLTAGTGVSITSATGPVPTVAIDTAVVPRLGVSNTFTTSPQQINAASSAIGLIIRGNATTPGNLQEWQNSAGTVLANIRSDGGLYVTANSDNRLWNLGIGGSSNGISWFYVTPQSASQKLVVFRGFASQTANLTEWQESGGTVRAAVDASGFIVAGSSTSISNALISSRPYGATQVGIAVRGAASQTANLQEWQNSAGTVNAWIASDGTPVTASGTGLKVGGTGITGHFTVRTPSASTIAAVIRGAASQTANLQEWQDSSGSAGTYITALGRIFTNQRFAMNDTNFTGFFTVFGASASTVQAIIRGASGQTANLTEWQDSSGNILARVTSGGELIAQNIQTPTAYATLVEESSGGRIRLTKLSTAATNPGANMGKLYFRDGTTAGTLKLVVRAGASGAETTILDNIPQ